MIMHNLQNIFLYNKTEYINPELDLAIEALKEGNSETAHEHMLNLIRDEINDLPNEPCTGPFLRFCNISNAKGYNELKQDIKNGRITLSNPYKFNDPMDPLLKVWIKLQEKDSHNKIDKKLFRAAKTALKNLRICCLSNSSELSNNIPLMWSHYANSHKGIAIQYTINNSAISKYNDSEHVLKLCRVAYRDHKVMSDYITLDNALVAKSSCWEYEKEHRLIYFTSKSSELYKTKEELRNENPPTNIKRRDYLSLEGFNVDALYLGTNIDPKKETEILDIAEIKNIPVYKMKYDTNDITRLIHERKSRTGDRSLY